MFNSVKFVRSLGLDTCVPVLVTSLQPYLLNTKRERGKWNFYDKRIICTKIRVKERLQKHDCHTKPTLLFRLPRKTWNYFGSLITRIRLSAYPNAEDFCPEEIRVPLFSSTNKAISNIMRRTNLKRKGEQGRRWIRPLTVMKSSWSSLASTDASKKYRRYLN